MAKRELFSELVEGVEAMAEHRQGKLTLKTHTVKGPSVDEIDGDFIRETREQLGMSQGVFAECLGLERRTLERWEQHGRPSRPAAVLIKLVRHYPDTVERLSKLSC